MTLEEKIRLGSPVTLEQVLRARERRAARQRALLQRGDTLISFTLNLPGEYKVYPLARRAFLCGQRLIAEQLTEHRIPVIVAREHREDTGDEGYHLVSGDPAPIKRRMVAVEQGHPLGRLFDIDVLGPDGISVPGCEIGRDERRCIVCGGPVWACARSRAHPAAQLALHTASRIEKYFVAAYADQIAGTATRALLYEVCATPKPGLVDRRNNGAHRDMTVYSFLDSACALTPFFRDTVRDAATFPGGAGNLLPQLRYPGQQAERAMLASTGGVNTHKGLIFSMGIVCAALGWLYGREQAPTPDLVFRTCAEIARSEKQAPACTEATPATYGEAAQRRHGLAGVRGEAVAGFPHVQALGYPALQRWTKNGLALHDAAVIALLHLMAEVDDTNLVGRGGLDALREVQRKCRSALREQQDPARLLAFAGALDSELTRAGLSPGGSADLLALSLFAYFLFDEGRARPVD